jgi:hypothetical protein
LKTYYIHLKLTDSRAHETCLIKVLETDISPKHYYFIGTQNANTIQNALISFLPREWLPDQLRQIKDSLQHPFKPKEYTPVEILRHKPQLSTPDIETSTKYIKEKK